MKICLISNLYNPYILGGAEIYVERIAKYLAKKNEVIIITTKPYEGLSSLKLSVEIKDNIKIYRFYPLNIYHTYHASNIKIPDFLRILWHIIDLWNIHSYFIIKKILKKEKPNVVHTHNLSSLSHSTFDAVKSLKFPLVHKIVDCAIICPYAVLLCPMRNWKICKYPIYPCKIYRKIKNKIVDNKPDIVTAPSQLTLDMHTKNGFFRYSKKICLPNGIEIDNQFYINNSNFSFDIGGNLKNTKINILYVGGLTKYKGVHILINAFKQIKNKNVKLHIVGGGNYQKNLKALAKKDGRITFYGKLSNEEVQGFYKIGNIVIVPSICYDNLPGVIQESFRVGTPVIGSRIGGLPESIKNGHNGFLFEPGNTKQLKEILENIIKNPGQLKELSKNARKSVEKYEISKHVEKLINIYKEAIKLNKQKYR
jgi:glycosyltransferase involved in cell wall biosynthesis